MSPNESVLAICVNWNGDEVLQETLRSLLDSDHSGLRVVVVDNNSDDLDQESLPSEVELLQLRENHGYGGAINLALREFVYTSEGGHPSAPEFILVLNNDLLIPPEAIPSLLRYAFEKGADIVGPKIVQSSKPERLEAAWGQLDWSHVLVRLRGKNALKTDPAWQQERNVEILLGSFLLIRREVFDEVGLFDPIFFMYHEEVDFQYRANNKGFSIVYCPSVEILHKGAFSTRKNPELKTFWIRRNTVLFLRKHGASAEKWVKFVTTLILSLVFNLFLLRIRRVRAILNGFSEGISLRISNE